jgi:hypothetical protein
MILAGWKKLDAQNKFMPLDLSRRRRRRRRPGRPLQRLLYV